MVTEVSDESFEWQKELAKWAAWRLRREWESISDSEGYMHKDMVWVESLEA